MYCCKVNIASPPTIYSLSPNPSPNREGSESYYLQMKEASRWCEERLSWIGRNALLKWRRAFLCFCSFVIRIRVTMLSMSKTSNISYFNYLFNNYTLCCQTDVVRLIHTTSSDHCSYNSNHLILDIIQCNHRLLSSFYKPLIIFCNLWTSPYRG